MRNQLGMASAYTTDQLIVLLATNYDNKFLLWELCCWILEVKAQCSCDYVIHFMLLAQSSDDGYVVPILDEFPSFIVLQEIGWL